MNQGTPTKKNESNFHTPPKKKQAPNYETPKCSGMDASELPTPIISNGNEEYKEQWISRVRGDPVPKKKYRGIIGFLMRITNENDTLIVIGLLFILAAIFMLCIILF